MLALMGVPVIWILSVVSTLLIPFAFRQALKPDHWHRARTERSDKLMEKYPRIIGLGVIVGIVFIVIDLLELIGVT